ncbi:MAG: TlpA disulfide reductase family protein [Polyangiaceae bacterium]
MLRVAVATSIFGIFGLCGCASQPPPPSHPSPLLGNPMPPFQSQTISGNPVISGAYQGHTVVVSFVASKCDSCEKTLSAAQELYADNHQLVVVGVFQKDRAEGAVPVAARLALRFPIIVDKDGSISRQFQIGSDAVPSTFVVDPDGRVRWVGGSDLTVDGLDRAVQAAR